MTKIKRSVLRRNNRMEELFKQGKSMQVIGDMYGLSRERVRQILANRGVDGRYAQALRKTERTGAVRKRAEQRRGDKILRRYGCSVEEYGRIMRGRKFRIHSSCPAYAYLIWGRNVAAAGNSVQLTFPEWWAVWQKSGAWYKRHRKGPRYALVRIDRNHPYRVGNVRIAQMDEVSHVRQLEAALAGRLRRGTKHRHRGVTYIPSDNRWRAFCALGGRTRYLGQYKTEEEAAKAYAKAVQEVAR